MRPAATPFTDAATLAFVRESHFAGGVEVSAALGPTAILPLSAESGRDLLLKVVDQLLASEHETPLRHHA